MQVVTSSLDIWNYLAEHFAVTSCSSNYFENFKLIKCQLENEQEHPINSNFTINAESYNEKCTMKVLELALQSCSSLCPGTGIGCVSYEIIENPNMK